MLSDVNLKELNSLLDQSSVSIVLIYTTMCGTCESAKTMLNVVSEAIKEPTYLKINVNLNQDLIKRYDISSVPCFLVFKKNLLIDQFYAFHSVTYLFNKIKPYSSENC
jgi:thioredoxin 1